MESSTGKSGVFEKGSNESSTWHRWGYVQEGEGTLQLISKTMRGSHRRRRLMQRCVDRWARRGRTAGLRHMPHGPARSRMEGT